MSFPGATQARERQRASAPSLTFAVRGSHALRPPAERNLFCFVLLTLLSLTHLAVELCCFFFFLLSTLTSCLFLMTHFWETAPGTTISGFIHKGQRRQLHPALAKRGKNPSWALASHCNCALLPPLLRLPPGCHGYAPGESGPGLLFLPHHPSYPSFLRLQGR